MKIKTLILTALLIPNLVFGATTVGWNTPTPTTGWIQANLVNGVNQVINAIAGIFTSASSTFAGPVRFPSISNGCLFTSGFVLTSTGSPCGTGSGTVGVGNQGQVPFYNANGNTLTATSAIFIAQSGNVGIGTTTPGDHLILDGNNFIANGVVGAGDNISLSGDGARMIWYPKKSAFLVGSIDDGSGGFDDANIGDFSINMGSDTSCTGTSCVSIGNTTKATNDSAVAIGSYNNSSGPLSFTFGSGNTASGGGSSVFGQNSVASGDDSISIGLDSTLDLPLPEVSGNSSLGIFMGPNTGVNITANDVMAVMGGSLGIGTTTPGSLLSIGNTGGINFYPTATSTFGSSANGINIKKGCFSINGTCVGGGGSSTGASTTLLADFNTFSNTNNFTGKLGLASSSPWGQLSVNPNALGSGVPEFVVGSSTATHFVIDGGGRVGIGSSTPTNLLDVSGNGSYYSTTGNLGNIQITPNGNNQIIFNRDSNTGISQRTYNNTGIINGLNTVYHAGGTQASPTATQNGFTLGTYSFGGHTGSGLATAASISSFAESNWAVGAASAALTFNTLSGSGAIPERMRITSLGNVLIGTTTGTYGSLIIASSTSSQLVLGSGLNEPSWAERAAGGNLYFATSSPLTGATSTGSVSISSAAVGSSGGLWIATGTPTSIGLGALEVTGKVYFHSLSTATNKNAVCIDSATNQIVTAGNTTCITSALKTKTLIGGITSQQALGILGMQPMEYYNKDGGDRRYGFIADWVKDTNLVEYSKTDNDLFQKGEVSGFDYNRYTALLTKFTQDLYYKVDKSISDFTLWNNDQDKSIKKLEDENKDLKARIEVLESKIK